MQMKCEEKMAVVVSEATRGLTHELKKSDRQGLVLQSKLKKAEVDDPFPPIHVA